MTSIWDLLPNNTEGAVWEAREESVDTRAAQTTVKSWAMGAQGSCLLLFMYIFHLSENRVNGIKGKSVGTHLKDYKNFLMAFNAPSPKETHST